MKKTMALAFLYVVLFSSGPLVAKETIVIGVLDFPPFYHVGQGDKPTGYLLDYLNDLAAKAGYDCRIDGYPSRRLFKYLRDGRVNLYAGIKGISEYDNDVIYSQKKITDIDLRIYTRGDTPMVHCREELKGKRIMVISGYNYGGLLPFLEDPANRIILERSNDHDLVFKKLIARRGDYVLDYYEPSEFVIKQLNATNIQSRSLTVVDAYLILSKKTPNAAEIMNRLEQACDALSQEGRYLSPKKP